MRPTRYLKTALKHLSMILILLPALTLRAENPENTVPLRLIEGKSLESVYDLPDNYHYLNSKLSRAGSVDFGSHKLLAIHHPVHHTQNLVLFLFFKKTAKGHRYLSRSNFISNIPGACCDRAIINKTTRLKGETHIYFSLKNPLCVYHYKLRVTKDSGDLNLSFLTHKCQ